MEHKIDIETNNNSTTTDYVTQNNSTPTTKKNNEIHRAPMSSTTYPHQMSAQNTNNKQQRVSPEPVQRASTPRPFTINHYNLYQTNPGESWNPLKIFTSKVGF